MWIGVRSVAAGAGAPAASTSRSAPLPTMPRHNTPSRCGDDAERGGAAIHHCRIDGEFVPPCGGSRVPSKGSISTKLPDRAFNCADLAAASSDTTGTPGRRRERPAISGPPTRDLQL